ncbi:MAG: UDP-2,3-diacylglucosamine diphosphatase LpxI [Thalassobaculum sp.]|uniref:LpxI family protein n=1 Tax=Thalassobaculum sp. TaxID=2022740 RepID=UPI0032EB8C1D
MSGLGIVAGGGVLPRRIAETAAAAGRPVFVVAFEGHTDAETVAGLPHVWLKLGQTNAALRALREADCADVVMAGPMRRPTLSSLSLDFRSMTALARAGSRVFGDDGLLSVIVEEIEREGFQVVGVEDVIGGYLAPEGMQAGRSLDAADERDVARGIAALHAVGGADIGQAVAVQEGLVLAVEAIEGTDAMIARAGALRRPGPGPVLVKGAKPGQEQRADRPTVGEATVAAAKAAGFRGIVVEAGATLVIDREATVGAVEAAGLFLLARRFAGPT